MNLVLDANVLLSAFRPSEPQFLASREFLRQARFRGHILHGPTLASPECAGAIARATGESGLALRILNKIEKLSLEWAPLSISRARAAAEIARDCRLRGADAVYVGLASELQCPLLTWDQEVLSRGATVAKTMTPEPWLLERSAGQGC